MKAKIKKTHSKNKTKRLFLFIALILGVMICVGISLLIHKQKDRRPVAHDPASLCFVPRQVELGEECMIRLEVAATASTREQGLSGRKTLAYNRGMIFEFDTIGRQCMWMKDMRFSLDMIWIDTNNTILKIEPNVEPRTYPNPFCADNTKKVIELSAGKAKQLGLRTGDRIGFGVID